LKTFYKKFSEKFIEGLLMLSGTITSLTVVLIVIFLFKEGIGVFNQKAVESGYVVAVNKGNHLDQISSEDIKNIYDQKITHWSELGGKPDSIILFRVEDISNFYSDEEIGENFERLPACISRLTDSLPDIIAFFPEKYLDKNFKGKVLNVDKIKLSEFFGGKEWLPTAQPSA
jgi:phosphate transport system permease protein